MVFSFRRKEDRIPAFAGMEKGRLNGGEIENGAGRLST
jgi:hypothetical protein